MIVADTSVWISYMREDDQDLVDILKKYLQKNHVYTVSAIFGELFQGAKSLRETKIIQIIWESLPKVDEGQLFLRAGHLSQRYKLHAKEVGLIDSYILSACLDNGYVLWTLDKKLQQAYDELSDD